MYRVKSLLVLMLVLTSQAREMTRCEVAVELVANGMPMDLISDWVCLVESESSRNTSAVGGPNSNGSFDWGLFQINEGFWCTSSGPPGLDCNISCSNLINDDITDDCACAHIIYNRHGFLAWHGWEAKCQDVLPDVSSCFNTTTTIPTTTA